MDALASALREADLHFPDLDLEHKTLLNDTGKIIGILDTILVLYRYAPIEKQLEIRKWMHDLRLDIEKQKQNLGNIVQGGE